MARKVAALGAWAIALALVVLALPVHSPDAGWHLGAGRWIWEHRAVPRADPFSFTAAGAPWTDFEWAFQLAAFAAWRLGADAGLWALKALLLLLAWLPVDGLLRDCRAGARARALALGLWSAALLSKADARPDLISAALFALQIRHLAAGRASFLFGFIVFAAWANLHGGFILGLALCVGWALVARLTRRPAPEGLGAQLCGAALGTLLNPYGLSLYSVFAVHLADPVAARVAEWGAYDAASPLRRPGLAALALGAWGAWRARREEPALAAAAGALIAATLASGRFSAYWPAAGVPLAALALDRARGRAGTTARTLSALVLAALVAAASRGVEWGRAFSDSYAGRSVAEFVARESAALGNLRLFNMYEWGGWLGLITGRPVFGDGRYLFHRQPAELEEALSSPEALEAFAARHKLDGFLLRRFPARVAGELRRPDGTTIRLERPWYLFVLPSRRWALVWWDARGLVFVDRARVHPQWLEAHEYRWWRPGDEAALADALAHGAVKPELVAAERARHDIELSRP